MKVLEMIVNKTCDTKNTKDLKKKNDLGITVALALEFSSSEKKSLEHCTNMMNITIEELITRAILSHLT